jgi:hypothetical protein
MDAQELAQELLTFVGENYTPDIKKQGGKKMTEERIESKEPKVKVRSKKQVKNDSKKVTMSQLEKNIFKGHGTMWMKTKEYGKTAAKVAAMMAIAGGIVVGLGAVAKATYGQNDQQN